MTEFQGMIVMLGVVWSAIGIWSCAAILKRIEKLVANPVTPADATDVGSPVLTHEKGQS